MPTIPKRWPRELEAEREDTEKTALQVVQLLTDARAKADTAREKIISNPDLTVTLLADVERLTFDARALLERTQRFLTVCKRTPLEGRWPSVAARQRDDALLDAQEAATCLSDAQHALTRARDRIRTNPGLTEVALADVTYNQARTLLHTERIARLMAEATLGRE